jgi:hypothetical protein
MNKFILALIPLQVAGLTLTAAGPAEAQEPAVQPLPSQACLMKKFPLNLGCGLVPVPEQPSGGVLVIQNDLGGESGGVITNMTNFQNFDNQKVDLKNLKLELPKLLPQ